MDEELRRGVDALGASESRFRALFEQAAVGMTLVSLENRFERVNQRLAFDREAATGFHLDVDAGSTERWAPGETRTVRLVRAR